MAARLTAIIVVTIVAVTLIAGFIVGAQRDETAGPIDLIIVNGVVYPADGSGAVAEAIAVRGTQVLKVGSNREIKRLRRAHTNVIDAHGGAVVPGFNDAHLNFVAGGRLLDRVNLSDAATLEEIQSRVAGFASQHATTPWVLGSGWRHEVFSTSTPKRDDLDAVLAERPAYLESHDDRTGWANSKALALAGITKDTPNPPNGVIVKDSATGEPTGIVKDAATDLIESVIPAPERAELLESVRTAIHEAHRFGVTSVQSAHGDARDLELYDELRRTNDLQIRIYATPSVDLNLTEADADRLDAVRQQYPEDPLLKTGGVEILADALSPVPPAATKKAVLAKRTSGPAQINRVVGMMDKRGWQIMIRAEDAGAVHVALDAFESAAAANEAPARGRRHRIEHIESIDVADIPRFGALGVIASTQPFRQVPDINLPLAEAEITGLHPALRAQLWKTVRDLAGDVTFGSNWPMLSMDPRLGLRMTVNPAAAESVEEAGWLPGQRLTLMEGIDAYTSQAAYASFDEHRKGTLAPGMLADIAILSTDLFSLPPERMLEAVVEVTIFDGKVVYTKPPAENTD